MNNKTDLGKYDLKKLINGVGNITDGLGEVFEGIKSMPIEVREDAIELLEIAGTVQDANQKLCETINRIIDRDSVDDLRDLNIFTKS